MNENNNEIEELKRKLQEEENKKERKKLIILLLLLLLLIILIILWTHAIKRPTITLGEKDINENYTATPSVTPSSPPVQETIIYEITQLIQQTINVQPTPEPTIEPTPETSPSPTPSPDINKEFIVSSQNKKWTENLSIFDNEKYSGKPIIYPGIGNTYYFELTNEKDVDVECSIEFKETNKDNVPIKYKLKENGEYIRGDKNTYVDYSELDIEDIIVEANSQNVYELEWKWVDSNTNDNKYGDISKTITYTLQITVEATEN